MLWGTLFQNFFYAYYLLYSWNHTAHNVLVVGIHLYLKVIGVVFFLFAGKLNEGNGAQDSCKIFSPLNKSTPKKFLTS